MLCLKNYHLNAVPELGRIFDLNSSPKKHRMPYSNLPNISYNLSHRFVIDETDVGHSTAKSAATQYIESTRGIESRRPRT